MSLCFQWSDEQQCYRERLREFGREVLAPRRAEWDRERTLPRPMLLEAIERGLLAAAGDYVTRGILVEEVGYADFKSEVQTAYGFGMKARRSGSKRGARVCHLASL